ncbi:MAG: c-type cytochrome biogenesis protein CcmI [Chloroflexota bacterium]
MPDLVQWLLLLVAGLAVAAAIGWPLLNRGTPSVTFTTQPEAEARALRHRVALEGLLDVEADRRAGSLDDASYERERAEAEARAAATLEPAAAESSARPASSANARVPVAGFAALIALALLVGFALPGSIGLGQRTVVNQAVADAIRAEADRQAEIQRLLGVFGTNPNDAQVVSDLADAYLAGGSSEDLQRAAVALEVLLALRPGDTSAYRRLVTAYIAAADWSDARAATDSYAAVATPDEPDIPFFRGLIAFRQGDNATALREFDRFLELGPDDGRVAMVSSLRAQAAGDLSVSSEAPGS